jgi:HSP20 family protein
MGVNQTIIMSLIRFNNPNVSSWSPLSSLSDQLNRFFDLAYPSRAAESLGDWSPALDAFEDKDKYVVSLEVPGLKKEDINVVVHDGVLTVSGERKSEKDVKEGTVHRTERYYGKFSRSVSLPAAVKADKVSASYKDGVLIVEVPKAEEAKPKSIEVKIS